MSKPDRSLLFHSCKSAAYRRGRAVILGCLVAGALGCSQPVAYELVFPSTETFLISQTAVLTVYEPEERTADEICRNLSASLPAGQSSVSSSGALDVCDFAAEGGVTLTDVPTGRLVFFAEITGGPERLAIMKGCTVADVYADTTEVVSIQLSTLPSYPEDPEILCADTDAKCVDLQSCTS